MGDILLKILYILCGLIASATAILSFKDKKHPARVGTTMFWGFLALILIFGEYIPANIVGIILILMSIITAIDKVKAGSIKGKSDEFKQKKSEEIGNFIFIPALMIAVFAFIIAQFTDLGGLVGVGIGATAALITGLIMTKAKPIEAIGAGGRLLQQMGSPCLLPPTLAALGALFNAAGVGEVIAKGISSVVPMGNIVLGVIAYVIGMVVFTMIMGNAFAAFAVITAGVGGPFVLSQGGNPGVIAALAMTAGYCGTLLTPMAANFNIVPATLLEMKDERKVIKSQVPVALALMVVHVILMLVLGFK
ncbi:DUF979 domain-containing protein [Clostridium sp. Cult2]|uniref:DUF979 domain-containing protein n=1 Tax=Clostridium sp. Cult2 TaxID=2079003 RepID=UPI001F26FA9B|nr:DUF979 domain-containing protein [Clostridium sp. Cult2]MCF6464784.1 DUF979 domain-containing protein [Clostridium sp. Cult2]